MRIILTTHAKIHMEERVISRPDLEECIRHPARIIGGPGRIRRFQKSFAYGMIEIVAEVRGDHCIIITVYPL